MWKDSLTTRFHKRSESLKAQGDPLIPSKGPRPFSTATLDPVQEQENIEHPREVPRVHFDGPTSTNSQPTMSLAAPTSAEKATPPFQPSLSTDIESTESSKMSSVRTFMMEEIDTTQATAPLSAYCFMTGFTDAVVFSAVYIWCAFQTGNTTQLALAIARLFNGSHDYTFHIADQQALCSVLSFIAGAFIGRIGDKIGCKTRSWMTLGTFIQTIFTMVAAITIWKSHSGSVADSRGDPAWSNALSFLTIGFLSAAVGLQGIMGKRLNTQFTTTVVLTTTWCELVTEPQLFNLRRLVISRDHKVMAITFLFVGGFLGRALLDKIGPAGTLGVATGIRFIITLSWLFVPAKKVKQ